MINKFEKQLEKWNGGVLRGAQAKLARLLRVSTATVALWTTGKRRPSKGYAAQMAQLFGLDAYDVMRLFPLSTTYPELQPSRHTRSLRDAQGPENAYSADNYDLREDAALSNSVSLPVLENYPEYYPQYQDGDVAEWWTVPRHAAKGAKYLVRTPEKQDVLYFIRPEKEPMDGLVMFLKTPEGYCVKRVRKEGNDFYLQELNGHPFTRWPLPQIQFIGTVVRETAAVL